MPPVRPHTPLGLLLAICVLGVAATPAVSAPGDLDASFGTGGVAATHLNNTSYAQAAALDAGDRVLAVGTEQTYGIAAIRYLSDGRLDNTTNDPGGDYDGDGVATYAIPGHNTVEGIDVVIDGSGRALVLARAYNTTLSIYELVVVRLTTSGALDGTFGSGGYRAVTFGPTGAEAGAIGLQSDGRIIVAGIYNHDFVARRLSATDGTIDNTFGTGGLAQLDPVVTNNWVSDLTVDASDRIVLAGDIPSTDPSPVRRFALVRFTANGAPDGGFGTGGLRASTFPDGTASARSITLTGDGGYVAAGDGMGGTRVTVARYTSSGELDTTFSGDGMQTAAAPGFHDAYGEDVRTDPQGRIVVGGLARTAAPQVLHHLVARFEADGDLDTAFAGDGIATHDVGDGFARGLVIQSTGRLVTVGSKGADTAAVGFEGNGSAAPAPDNSPPPDFVPAPPTAYQESAPPMLWRIQGIEVTQGTQRTGLQESDQANGNETVQYSGVKLARGGRTFARVYVNAAVPVNAQLFGYGANGKLRGAIRPSSPYRSLDLENEPLDVKQQESNGGFQFELPDSWVRGRLRLEAMVEGVSDYCTHPGCGKSVLDNIVFTTVRPIKIRIVALTIDDKLPPDDPWPSIERAMQLVPQDTRNPIQVPHQYAAKLEVGDLQAGTKATICDWWYWCHFRTRDESNTATLERLQDWDEKYAPADRKSIDLTIGVSADPNIGMQNAASVFPWHGQSQWCSIGGVGSAFLCTRPVMQISEQKPSWAQDGRPLTSAGHELYHSLGRPHASKGCDGGGEDWPPDQRGELHGVGFDYGRGIPGTGVPIFLPFIGQYEVLPMWRIVGENGPYYTSPAGPTNRTMDLMSYCGAGGGGDQYSWISPHNWDGALELLDNDKPASRRAVTAGRTQPRVAIGFTDAAAGPRMEVNAVQIGDELHLSAMEQVTGRTPEIANPDAVPHIVFRDEDGREVSDTPMEALQTHVDSETPTPVTLLRATTPVPPAGVQSVALEQDGEAVDTIERSKSAPQVRMLAPRGGRPARGEKLTVRWRATDADGDYLVVALEYAADGKSYRQVWSGPNDGRATLLSSMLEPGRQARFRLVADDGFNRGAGRTPPFRVAPRPPAIAITGIPRKRRVLAGQVVALQATATELGGVAVPANRMTWFRGKKRIARGADVTLTAPKKGKVRLRLVVRPASGPAATRRITLRVVKPKG